MSRTNSRVAVAFTLVALGLVACGALADPAGTINWPSYRGESAAGVSQGYPTATTWSLEPARNVKWKVTIPGLAHSSPIIWQDRLFVTTAVSDTVDQKLKVGLYGDIEPVDENGVFLWKVFCLDKNTGKVLWEQTAQKGRPKMKRHPKSSHASETPATDGKRVVAFFGSEGLHCYDMEGKPLWSRDLGLMDSGYYRVAAAQWGFASSPILFEDKVIVQCDVQKNSFLAALDATDGHELWRTPRDEVPTWSTPTVYRDGNRTQIIVNGYKHIGGYDLATGKELWSMKGGGDIPVPTPVVAHGLIFITNAHGSLSPIYAIRPDSAGDVTLVAKDQTSSAAIAWSQRRGGNYMQTPLVVGDYLYCCLDNGILTCIEAKTGKQVYRQRLGGSTGFTASGVAADGKLYFTSEEGDTYVIKAGPAYQLLATNALGETFMSTPAISQGVIFFRARSQLIAIGGGGN